LSSCDAVDQQGAGAEQVQGLLAVKMASRPFLVEYYSYCPALLSWPRMIAAARRGHVISI
jgi:hypothetical protein